MDITQPIPVLDEGYVQYKGHLGDDNKALEWARMSTGNPTGVDESKDDATRAFLWRSGHVSPFEGPVLELEVQAPIFVIREWFRHDQHVNEFSGRYSIMPDLYYRPNAVRLLNGGQDPVKKQGSGFPMSQENAEWFLDGSDHVVETARAFYEQANERGFSRELARIVLPLNQYSRFRVQTTARNWMFFLNSRLSTAAQWEIRQYGKAVGAIFRELWPKTWELLEEHTLEGVHLSRTEKLAVAYALRVLERYGDPAFKVAEVLGTTMDDPSIGRLLDKLGMPERKAVE